MRWRDHRRSSNVDDRRGQGPALGRGPMRLPIGGGGRRIGIGGVILALIAVFVFGADPLQVLGGMVGDGGGPVIATGPGAGPAPRTAPGTLPGRGGVAPGDEAGAFVSAVVAQTEDVWREQFPAQLGQRYQDATVVLFNGATRSACGGARSEVGPHYCPLDSTVYLDLDFFDQLARRLGAQGDFALAYVIAHEIGHHIQNQLGILEESLRARAGLSDARANQVQVQVELMADCLAGVWAHHAEADFAILEAGDLQEAVDAAAAVGDDAIQRRTQGHVVPDSFTHGSSRQRMAALTRGLEQGDARVCIDG